MNTRHKEKNKMNFNTLYSKEIYEQLKLEQYNKTEITNKLIEGV